MRRLVCVAAAGLALGGCGGSSHASSSAASAGAPASGGSAASTSGSGPVAGSGAKAGHVAKSHRHSVHKPPPQVVAGTGGVVVPAAHVTLSAAPPAARTAFVSAADAVCRDYRAEVARDDSASTLAEQEKVYAAVVDDATRAIVRLQGISPPAAMRSLFLRYLALTGGAIDDFAIAQRRSRSTKESAGTQVDARDFSAFSALARRVTVARGVAHRLGLSVCGSAGSDWL
jgi:hypothetical protein